MPLSTIKGAEIENKGCIPSFPCKRAARDASGKWSYIFKRCISSGIRLHYSTTDYKYLSGSTINFSIESLSAKTQYFSLYLKTPRFGFPGIKSPSSTMFTKQNPRKSKGICMKLGVLFGMSLRIVFPTT